MVYPDPDRNPHLVAEHSPIKVKTLNLPMLSKKNNMQMQAEQASGGFNSPSKGQKHYSELAR